MRNRKLSEYCKHVRIKTDFVLRSLNFFLCDKIELQVGSKLTWRYFRCKEAIKHLFQKFDSDLTKQTEDTPYFWFFSFLSLGQCYVRVFVFCIDPNCILDNHGNTRG